MKGRKDSSVICGKNERRHVTNFGEMTEKNFSILNYNPMEGDSKWAVTVSSYFLSVFRVNTCGKRGRRGKNARSGTDNHHTIIKAQP